MSLANKPAYLLAIAFAAFAGGVSAPASAQVAISEVPLYLQIGVAPLNMMVMGKDHKLYYEAYNDTADLNGDGILDVGYKPDQIEYFGYFNSKLCYTYVSTDGGRFEPQTAGTGSNGKQCGGTRWSGDFLNYLTTSRIDALRKVLYGGRRVTDTDDLTVLEGNFIPQDGHTWGKEYRSITRDGFNIADYAPLTAPSGDNIYHLFAVTSLADGETPRLRVLTNSQYRIWEWVSIERPVGGDRCLHGGSGPSCTGGSSGTHPGHPGNRAAFDTMETTYAVAANSFGDPVTRTSINCTNDDCNYLGQDTNYLTIITGYFATKDNNNANGKYRFCISGDDAVDLEIREDGPTGTVLAQIGHYGGHGAAACTSHQTGQIDLVKNSTYWIKFRHEEASGGDKYQMQWTKETGGSTFGWTTFDRTQEGGSGVKRTGLRTDNTDFTFAFYDLAPPTGGGATRTDHWVRVKVCPEDSSADGDNAALREANCKKYGSFPNANYKPTGLLHDYGETDRMFFGLMSGSQFHNLEGGVLRQNIKSFQNEVDASTGIFSTTAQGLVDTLNKFRVIGFRYPGAGNYTYNHSNCPNLGTRGVVDGECRMWGNPIGEIMFEGLRYFAGGTAHSGFATGGNSHGVTEETTLGLPTPAWKDPYKTVANGGLGHKTCAKPVMTVISDINPSFDSDLPGNPWNTVSITSPSTLSDFDFSTLGQKIWGEEFGSGSKNIYIGEVDSTKDGNPTAKSASSFGNIRGLAPEEPTKRGSYAAAMVANYGWTKSGKINPLSAEKLRTYSVALASPLPRINFPINNSGGFVTLVPLGKTVGGCFGTVADAPLDTGYWPTNTIVDFYVEQLVNGPGFPTDASINGGRPYAVFRINYEDVEQGNDHDMDAIARYEVAANADGTVTITVRSEYAAGCVIQHLGYIISGTTADGVYLEVRDRDTSATNSPAHWFNTPPGTSAGQCTTGLSTSPCNAGLPLENTRIFTPGTAAPATLLRDPLWYAAKYGGFNDINGNGKPDLQQEWDENSDGIPDKYFLVTNALTLKAQLAKAFDEIERDAKPSGGVAASGARKDGDFLAYVPEYNAEDWTGDVKAYPLKSDGTLGPIAWSAAAKLPDPADRKIYALVPNGSGVLETKEFKVASLGTEAEVEGLLGFSAGGIAAKYGAGVTATQALNYLRGDRSMEKPSNGPATAAKPFRFRSRVIGDILGSQPEVLSRGSAGYTRLSTAMGGGISGTGTYGDFVATTKRTRKPMIFVGANDGMLHAFDGTNDATNGGKELFAIMPNSVLSKTGRLLDPAYQHTYFVDSSPSIGDAYLGSAWKSILLAPAGAGGKSVLAVDVTNPAASFGPTNVMWELKHADLGNVIGRPRIVLANDNKWYALIANGLNSTAHSSTLLMVDVATGTVTKSLTAGTGTAANPNGLGAVTAVDANNDLRADIIYAGDYQGNVWKFDISGASPSDWKVAFSGQPLFKVKDRDDAAQLITGGVDVARHHLSGFMVYVGTGRYLIDEDNDVPADPQLQTFYGLWDNGVSTITDRGSLIKQQITAELSNTIGVVRTVTANPIDWATKRGWYLDLAVEDTSLIKKGERFIGEPRVTLGRVVFTTFTPIGDDCRPGGINLLYALSLGTGAAQLTLENCAGCAGLRLTGTDDSSPPALSPPIVVDPGEPPTPPGGDGGNNGGDGCDVNNDGVCDAADGCDTDGDGDCDVDDGCDVDGDGQCSDTNTAPPTSKECKSNLQVLLKDGAKTFSQVGCGRMSWRQLL